MILPLMVWLARVWFAQKSVDFMNIYALKDGRKVKPVAEKIPVYHINAVIKVPCITAEGIHVPPWADAPSRALLGAAAHSEELADALNKTVKFLQEIEDAIGSHEIGEKANE